MTNETGQGLERLSWLPDRDATENGVYIAGQKYYDVLFTGGSITGVSISGLAAPIPIADGGTGQITANAALNALLPVQTGNAGKALKTDGTNTSWSTDTDTGITQLTGDVTAGPGSGSQAATLATVNSNVGSIGSSTSIPSFTVNAKGLITAASGNVVVAPAGTLTGNTLASGVVTSSLTAVGTLSSLTIAGNLNMGGNTINITGGIATTGARVTKGWFSDIESTNAPTINGVAATGTGGIARSTSPTFVTPILGAAAASSINFSSTAGIIGTTTNNNAAAGSVGEIIESSIASGSAISLSSGVPANITSISLTIGDWDVWGNIAYVPGASTVTTNCAAGINIVSATVPTRPNGGAIGNWIGTSAAGIAPTVVAGQRRYSLSSTTTIYLISNQDFSASTLTGYGYIGARRIR